MERHAAAPNVDQAHRVRDELGEVVEKHVADPPAREHADRDVEDEILDLGARDRAVGALGTHAHAEPADHEAGHVHEPVPMDAQGAYRERDRIDVGVVEQKRLPNRAHARRPAQV